MLVGVEGGDAVGKKTQTTLLAKALGGTRIEVPDYKSKTGKAILSHLQREWCAGSLDYTESLDTPFIRPDSCDALVFQSLMINNRYEMVPKIEAALAEGPAVLDRWKHSATVYGACSGVDPKWLEVVQARLPEPDVWILLDLPVEEGFKRRPERRDRHETDRELLEKVRAEYLKMFGCKDLDWGLTRRARPKHADVGDACSGFAVTRREGWWVVDSARTVEEVHQTIMQIVKGEK